MNTVKAWATLAGIVLIATGLLGFLGTPLVGGAPGALVPTDALHNVVHLGTGALALWIAYGTSGRTQVDAMLGFGILYVVIFLAVLVSPTLFGLFSVPANIVIHVIHVAVAVVSLGVALMARSAQSARA
ncbi:MAG TPA: hypothetical protein VFJ80_12030 [Candidatus Limnocylindrales bacterium]|jgi:hypothetical protein|nr:hypothetical protein [Candidatus Limnocylindrales bacterium]